MNGFILQSLIIPFIGTTLGAACVFFMKKELNARLRRALLGFAAGVMVAASIWSLLIPSMEQAALNGMGKFSVFPAVIGFCVGMLFLLLLDNVIPHIHIDNSIEGPKSNLKKSTMMVLAVVLHNIPEGMAVGILYASWRNGNAQIAATTTVALAIGIAIQNFPEGAIISMPLKAQGMSKRKSFILGMFSGIVEPIAGIIIILISSLIIPILPYLLGFAAGAMLYVVVEELVPEMAEGEHTNTGTILFMIGFSMMLVLDVILG